MRQIFKNNASGELLEPITAAATTIKLKPGQGDQFPVAVWPDYFKATLEGADQIPEVIRVTRAAGADDLIVRDDVGAVSAAGRGLEGTTARAFPAEAVVELRVTAEALNRFEEKVDRAGDTMTGPLTLTAVPTAAQHAAHKGYVDSSKSQAIAHAEDYADGVEARAKAYTEGYAPTKAGAGATGTWGINISGNAGSATKLQTVRTISLSGAATGTATGFDGSANITIPVTSLDATKLAGRVPVESMVSTFNIDGSGPNEQANLGVYAADLGSIVGSTQNPTVTAAIVAATSVHRFIALSVDPQGYLWGYRSHTSDREYIFQSKAKFADQLTSARTINGVAFDGSANINITTASTPDTNDNSTRIATTAYTRAAIATHSPVLKVAGKTGEVTVTKADVGLGNVQNFGVATLEDAEQGTAADKYMTPERTAQAIAALAGGGGAPVGGLVFVQLDIPGAEEPNPLTHIRLKAGLTVAGAYNEGKLVSESVSGAAPSINATAVINVAGSPLNGRTVRLIEDERRFVRPGSPGTLEESANLWHGHTATFSGWTDSQGAHAHTWTAYRSNHESTGVFMGQGAGGAPTNVTTTTAGAHTHNVGGSVTINGDGTNESRPRNIGVAVYMRVR